MCEVCDSGDLAGTDTDTSAGRRRLHPCSRTLPPPLPVAILQDHDKFARDG